MASDVNAAVQAAIGGIAATQILAGRPAFRFRHPLQPEFRSTPEAIRNILLPTPDGSNVPLGQVADVSPRRRRLHDLSRKWPALHSHQIQRPRPRPCGHDSGRAEPPRGEGPLARGLPLRMGGRIRQPAEGAAAARRHYPHQPADYSGAAVYGVQFVSARAAGAGDSSVWRRLAEFCRCCSRARLSAFPPRWDSLR